MHPIGTDHVEGFGTTGLRCLVSDRPDTTDGCASGREPSNDRVHDQPAERQRGALKGQRCQHSGDYKEQDCSDPGTRSSYFERRLFGMVGPHLDRGPDERCQRYGDDGEYEKYERVECGPDATSKTTAIGRHQVLIDRVYQKPHEADRCTADGKHDAGKHRPVFDQFLLAPGRLGPLLVLFWRALRLCALWLSSLWLSALRLRTLWLSALRLRPLRLAPSLVLPTGGLTALCPVRLIVVRLP